MSDMKNKSSQNNNRNNYEMVNLVSRDPQTAALLAKVIPNPRQGAGRDAQGNRATPVPHSYAFKDRLISRAKRNTDAKMVLKLLPDIELAVQILTSSILAPSDMMTTELNYNAPANIFSSELSATLIGKIREHFEDVYPLKKYLPEMLRDIVAEKGSYPVAVIPENVIDDFINGSAVAMSKESISTLVDDKGAPKNVGILGASIDATPRSGRLRGLSLEAFDTLVDLSQIDTSLKMYKYNVAGEELKGTYVSDEFTNVTDNIMVLKFPKLNDVLRKKSIVARATRASGSFSAEGFLSGTQSRQMGPSDHRIEQQIYKPRSYQAEYTARLKKQHELPRKSVGNPLIMKLPSESVLPVHVPGDVTKHIGYFVLLDEEGNPITSNAESDYYSATSKGFGNTNQTSMTSNLLQRVNSNLGSGQNLFNNTNSQHLDYAAQLYGDMVERDLIARIKNGVHSSSAKIASNEEIYRVMLARALERKYTQLLYIPIDYLTYMTFKYDESGVGKSLIDDNSVINTLRTVMMFSSVLGAVKNSIGRTKVNVTIPEDDPDPVKTLEQAQEEIIRSRQLGLPLGISNPVDITDFLQRASFEWGVDGGNLPDLKFNFENNQSTYPQADTNLEDMLKKHSLMGMGVSPETVDNGFTNEFATVATQNNILFSKRIMQYQELFNPNLSEHARKIVLNTEGLISTLKDLVEENEAGIKMILTDDEEELLKSYGPDEVKRFKVSRSLIEFVTKFEICLPKPPSVTLEHQTDLVKNYTDFLDATLEAAFINENIVGDAMRDKVEGIRAQVKAYFLRQFMADKAIGTELGKLVAVTEDGKPQIELFKETAQHSEALIRAIVTNTALIKPIDDAAAHDLETMNIEPSTGSSGGSDDSSSSDDSGGMDDFGMGDFGDDSGTDDTSTEGDTTGDGDSTSSNDSEGDKSPEDEEPEAKPDL